MMAWLVVKHAGGLEDAALRTGILRDIVARQVTKGRVREERSSEGQRAESEPYVDRDLALVYVVRQELVKKAAVADCATNIEQKFKVRLSVSALQAPALISRSSSRQHHPSSLWSAQYTLLLSCCNKFLDL